MRRTSFWNNITNKHYWPKTGRSSQKQNMYEKQSRKPNWSKNKLQNFLPKDINETSWTDNVQPNIKFNIKNQLRRTSCWNNITNKYYWPKTGRSSQKQNMYEKQSRKPNWSKNKLQNFLPKDINETSWIDNIQPNIKVNINTNWEELPSETT